MLYDVEWSLTSIKHVMHHQSTFLLFSCMNNKVPFVWLRTSTLLHSRTRSKSSVRHVQRVILPKIRDHYLSQTSNLLSSSLQHTTCCIRLATQSNIIQQSWIQQYWMMLHSFGQGLSIFHIVQHCWHSTLLYHRSAIDTFRCWWTNHRLKEITEPPT